jgi:hypothetical protein
MLRTPMVFCINPLIFDMNSQIDGYISETTLNEIENNFYPPTKVFKC